MPPRLIWKSSVEPPETVPAKWKLTPTLALEIACSPARVPFQVSENGRYLMGVTIDAPVATTAFSMSL